MATRARSMINSTGIISCYWYSSELLQSCRSLDRVQVINIILYNAAILPPMLSASEGTLSRWPLLHLQSLAFTPFSRRVDGRKVAGSIVKNNCQIFITTRWKTFCTDRPHLVGSSSLIISPLQSTAELRHLQFLVISLDLRLLVSSSCQPSNLVG
jgi:hypothetical protein